MKPARIRPFVLAAATLLAVAGCSTKSNPVAPVPVPLSAVVVTPGADTIQVGQIVVFKAQAYDTLGALVGGVAFQWTTTNSTVFTVSGAGQVHGRNEGVAQLIVEAGGFSDTATVYVYPDTGWFVQPAPANGFNLNGVFALADGQHVWAVGDGGRVLYSTDAGAQWSAGTAATTFNLNAVWFTSATEGWAVGNGGTVMHTTNGGGTWSRHPGVPVSDNLYDVAFSGAATGWVVGGNGVVLRTVNGGVDWAVGRLPIGFALRSVSFAGQDGWAVGDGGTVVGTHDGGQGWFGVPSLTSQQLHAVWRRSASEAIAVGAQGTVLYTETTPDSVSWFVTSTSAGSDNTLLGVHLPTPTTVFAVGSNATLGGTVLRSDDAGQHWNAQSAGTTLTLHDVFFVDELHGWAVGDQGVILHTALGGRH